MHENDVYYSIQHELRRLLPEIVGRPGGLAEIDEIVLSIMTAIKESGIEYVNLREMAKIHADRT
ncbi:hypothetical protein [Rhodoblastus sp.]|uniref:hypothetical protein n=1 Tax=Rhodoblastus sp. TaxID=1962975 RepID=UPI003F99D99B